MGDENKPLDINEFLRKHICVKNWINYREQVYSKSELIQLIEMAMELFRSESTLATVSPPCTIVGDIHGQYSDLVRLLNSRITKEAARKKGAGTGFANNRWVFLGDYVDRGSHSIECICLVFAMKIVYPSLFTLLRGNHETRAINFAYGFREELMNKLGELEGVEVWDKFNEAFSWMPLACLIGGRILCMHGGIGPDLTSLDEIRKIKRPMVDVGVNRLAQDLLWADPTEIQAMPAIKEEPIYMKNLVRGLSVTFNDAAVHDVCARLNLHMIVRAHQMIPEGFKFYADRKLVTIFSAPRYMNETNNRGAVLKVDASGSFSILIMRNLKPLVMKAIDDEITRGGDERSKSESSKTSSSSSKSRNSTS